MTLRNRLADAAGMVPYAVLDVVPNYGYIGYAVAADQDLVSFMLVPQAYDNYLSVGFFDTAELAVKAVQDWIDGKWK